MSETKHTPGELSANGRFISAVGSIDTWHGPVHGTIIVCEPTEQSDGDGRNWTAGGFPEANAARIVLTWNCHDELVAALRRGRDGHGCQPGYITSATLSAVRSALAKAEGRT